MGWGALACSLWACGGSGGSGVGQGGTTGMAGSGASAGGGGRGLAGEAGAAGGVGGSAGSGGTTGSSGSGGMSGEAGAAGGGVGSALPLAAWTAFDLDLGDTVLHALLDDDTVVALAREVGAFTISPDGAWVAFVDGGGLKVVSPRGGSPTPLDPAPEVAFFTPMAWSRDGSTVAYLRQASAVELHVAAVDGSFVTNIAPFTLASSASMAPDGRHVAYVNEDDGVLWVAATDGSASPTQLGDDGADVAWTADGSQLFYRVGTSAWVANADGSGRTQIAADLLHLEASPDRSRLAFLRDTGTTATRIELFTVAADGSDERRINADLAGTRVLSSRRFWAPDGSRIAYTAAQDEAGKYELFTALPDGSGQAKVSGPMGPDQDVKRVTVEGLSGVYAWSPDSARLAYVSDEVTDGLDELFLATPDGMAAPVKVSGTMVAGGGIVLGRGDDYVNFQWSANGLCLSYRAEQLTVGQEDLFLVAADAATDCPAVQGLPQLMAVGGPVTIPMGSAMVMGAWSTGEFISAGADGSLRRSDASGTRGVSPVGRSSTVERLTVFDYPDEDDPVELFIAFVTGGIIARL